jgi:hypothetical protein
MKSTKLLVLALSLTFATAYAQTTGDERVLNSAPINVDGYLAEDKPVTDGELEAIRSELNKQKMGTQLNKEKSKDLGKLTKQTEKLLDSQDEYIDSKVESTQAIKEFNSKYEDNQKKLRCIIEELDTEECEPYKKNYRKKKQVEVEAPEEVQEVKVAQAAPVVSTAELAQPTDLQKPFEEIKLLPYAGGTTFNGEKESLETELSAGLRLESNITTRFSMGFGFNYNQMKTNDFANNMGYMNSGYMGQYGQQGREIQYNSMGMDFYGKFFITKGERFRPYVGAGLGYNRATMKYNDNSNYFDPMNAYNYGSEEYKASFATGQLMVGTEIMVTRGFGINIEAQYATGLGNSAGNSAKNTSTSPDQARLKDLGKEITTSNMLSLFAGAVVVF